MAQGCTFCRMTLKGDPSHLDPSARALHQSALQPDLLPQLESWLEPITSPVGASMPTRPHSGLFPPPPLPAKYSQPLLILYAMEEASQAGERERASYADPQMANAPVVVRCAPGTELFCPSSRGLRAGDFRVCPLLAIKGPPTWGTQHFQNLSFCLICFKTHRRPFIFS